MRLHRLLPLLLILAAPGCRVNQEITGPSGLLDASLKSNHHGRGAPGAVYVLNNAPGGNAVLAFERAPDGSLGAPVAYPTGGNGTGAGLGNQGGVILSADDRWLFAVNAGSNQVSAFRVHAHYLRLTGTVGSGGTQPVSLAARGDLLVVLNAGGNGNLAGFRIHDSGRLSPIAGATRPLSGNAVAAAQVSFTPDGDHLVVTERNSNRISVYAVRRNGSIDGPMAQPASGITPFGFGFDRRGTLIVAEAFGGAAGASAVSSYRIASNGQLHVVSPSVPTTETSACWIAVSPDDRFAYAANTGSGSVTGYAVHPDGSLTRLDADGVTATAGMGPADLAFARGGLLYVRNGGSGNISAYAQRADGSLESLPGVSGLPAGAIGLAAR